MKTKKAIEVLTTHQRCWEVFRSACEGNDCQLTWDELQTLQDCGYITDLKKVKGSRWSFEYTDKLEHYAKASPQEQERLLHKEFQDHSAP